MLAKCNPSVRGCHEMYTERTKISSTAERIDKAINKSLPGDGTIGTPLELQNFSLLAELFAKHSFLVPAYRTDVN